VELIDYNKIKIEAASSQMRMPLEQQYHTFHKQIATHGFKTKLHTDAKPHKINLLQVSDMVTSSCSTKILVCSRSYAPP
jgi:hypothetical protein